MKRFGLLLLCLTLLVFTAGHGHAAKPGEPATQVSASPAAMNPLFVQMDPVVPMAQGLLNLFGYEFSKQAQSVVILSPDKQLMATTELYFLPDIKQTNSRIDILMVGPLPALSDVLPPETLEKVKKTNEAQAKAHAGPTDPPKVKISEVDPQPFWNRYIAVKQLPSRQVVMDSGFDVLKAYRLDILQVVDWSRTGQCLLVTYRPGIYHLGVYRTLPIVYDRASNNIVKLGFLPDLIWKAARKASPGLNASINKTWDIRVLGWMRDDPEALIAKLVLFDGQSEYPISYWSYNWQSNLLQPLGNSIDPSIIAQNGWTVRFVDPNAQGGPHVYALGEIPPAQAPPAPADADTPKGWRQRLRFW